MLMTCEIGNIEMIKKKGFFSANLGFGEVILIIGLSPIQV